jgi:hypothetical protein
MPWSRRLQPWRQRFDRIGVVIRTEKICTAERGLLREGRAWQYRKFRQDERRARSHQPMVGDKDSVVFTLMASWWLGLDNDGLTIGSALIAR